MSEDTKEEKGVNEKDINFLLETVTQFEILMYQGLNSPFPHKDMLRQKQEHAIVLKGQLLKLRDSLEIERNLKKGV